MIQRIQTLYLLAAAILMALFCFLPFATFLYGGEVFKQTVWGINSSIEGAEVVARTIPMGILTVISALLPLATIFLFKRRGLQMRLCVVEIILLLGVVVYMVMYLFRSGSDITEKIAFSIVDAFPVLAMILVFVAFRKIMRDHLLIKSLDRIR